MTIDCLKNLEHDISARLDDLRNVCLAGQLYARDIEKLLFKVWINDGQYMCFCKKRI